MFRSFLLFGVAVATLVAAAPAQALNISEVRFRGPSGANDEFVELYNNTDAPLTVSTTDASSGWSVVTNDLVVRFTVPNGTVIPARGHYLGTNSGAYSLASTATGDVTYATDMPDNAGVAVFKTATPANFTLANRLDAVGGSGVASTLFREGLGLPVLTPFSIDSSFYRDLRPGLPKDTAANESDVLFVDTNGTSAGAGQRLGAPGPQNRTSPVTGPGDVVVSLLDPAVGANAAPNMVRPTVSDPANNATFGRVLIRRRITNLTAKPLTALAFRVADLTTFPSPSGVSDLRPQTVPTATVIAGGKTVFGTTLTGTSQPNGGGFNSLLTVPSVTAGSPLERGDSIDVQIQMGIQQTGSVRFCAQVEALPSGNGLLDVVGTTDGGAVPASQCAAPYARASGAPTLTTPAFADQPAGTVGEAQSVTVTNPGALPARLGRVDIAGDDFLIVNDACSELTLDAGASCVVRVRFAPIAAGSRSATLRVLGDILPQGSVALSATGTAAPTVGVGPAGATGPAGSAGTAGTAGAMGTAGAAGPAGPAAQVLCSTKKVKKKSTVSCAITVQTTAKATLANRSGRVLATATTRRGRVVFVTKRPVPAGTYVVRLAGGANLSAKVG